MSLQNRQLVFEPKAGVGLGPELFSLRTQPVREPGPGEVLVRNLILSCDPIQVGWLMSSSRYASQIAPQEVMRVWGAGHVVASGHEQFRVGDRVWGTVGWEDYTTTDAGGIQPLSKVADDLPLSVVLGIGGLNGISAYVGLVDICGVRAGERVVVSTAAGATGSAAVQIARALGAQVVGIAGTEPKCQFVRDVLGAQACIHYKSEDLRARLAEIYPAGVEVYFDNVGGVTLDTLLGSMASEGRVALCGATSQYSGETPAFVNVGSIAVLTLSVRGFVVFQFRQRFDAVLAQLHAWLRSGHLHSHEDLAHGLLSAPDALARLFQGQNVGKQLVVMEGASELEPRLFTAR